MADHAFEHPDDRAERTTRLLSHLDGALDASMLDAIHGAWSMLERAATDSPAHARAVRSRLLWESMSPGTLVEPLATSLVHDLVPQWDEDDEPLVEGELVVQPLATSLVRDLVPQWDEDDEPLLEEELVAEPLVEDEPVADAA